MTTKNAVDLVRDAVTNLNKIEVKVQNATRLLAASCMVFYSENGGNKHARDLLAPMLKDVTTSGVSKHILGWVGKNLSRYEPNLKAAMPEGAEAAREAVLAQFGQRPWKEVRSEHSPKVEGENPVAPPVKNVPADGPAKVVDEAAVVPVYLDAILENLRHLDVDALARVVDTANALITSKLAEQARPDLKVVNG